VYDFLYEIPALVGVRWHIVRRFRLILTLGVGDRTPGSVYVRRYGYLFSRSAIVLVSK
jgi:hypothetical protein